MQTIYRIDLSDDRDQHLYALQDAFVMRADAIEWARLHAMQWARENGWSLTALTTDIVVNERRGIVRAMQHRGISRAAMRIYRVKPTTLHEVSAVDALARLADSPPGPLERLKARLKSRLQALIG